MEFHEDDEIFLSQIISGMLLFNREFKIAELFDIMSFVTTECGRYISDQPNCYDGVYKYLEDLGDRYIIKPDFDYSSLIKVENMKMTLFNYLKNNTTDEVIGFLINKFHQDVNVLKKHESKPTFNIFDLFYKEKRLKKRKKVSM